MRQLISDLNLASRLEYAMQPLNKTFLSPVELVRQCISDFLNDGLMRSTIWNWILAKTWNHK